MPNNYISPISMDALSSLCSELGKNNSIKRSDFEKYHVKRGLRNEDGTGVMAGLTKICSVEGYYILDGERIPKDGKLSYRGYDIKTLSKIVSNRADSDMKRLHGFLFSAICRPQVSLRASARFSASAELCPTNLSKTIL